MVCCQEKHGINTATPAGKYGAMECDTPAETLDEILADVKEKVAAPEIILITGGLVSRDPFLS